MKEAFRGRGDVLPLTTKLLATNERFREEWKPLPSVKYPLDISPGSDSSNPTVRDGHD